MKGAGQIGLLRFPQVDLTVGKPRPILLLPSLPGRFEDWLVCMLSTLLHQAVPSFNEVLDESQTDFAESGVKIASVIRVARFAVVSADMLLGTTGRISPERLTRIRKTLANWICKD